MAKSYELALVEERAVARIQAMALRLIDAKKISRSELAKSMNVSLARVSQLLGDEPENLSMRKAAALFYALGEELVFSCRGIEDLDQVARQRKAARASAMKSLPQWRFANGANGNDACPQERGLAA